MVSSAISALSLLALITTLLVVQKRDSFAAMGPSIDIPVMPSAAPTDVAGAVAQAIGTHYLTIDAQSQPSDAGVIAVDATILGARCSVDLLAPPAGSDQWMPVAYTVISATCG
jgi:hypothetical protein